jgi:hypothetical protein
MILLGLLVTVALLVNRAGDGYVFDSSIEVVLVLCFLIVAGCDERTADSSSRTADSGWRIGNPASRRASGWLFSGEQRHGADGLAYGVRVRLVAEKRLIFFWGGMGCGQLMNMILLRLRVSVALLVNRAGDGYVFDSSIEVVLVLCFLIVGCRASDGRSAPSLWPVAGS